MQFLLPWGGSYFPESAKRASLHLQGPEPRTVSAPHVEQAKDLLRLCFIDTAHFGCPSQLANCS